MAQFVSTTLHDGVAVLRIDNPPVNALSAGVPEAIQSALDSALQNSEVAGIVLMGAGRTFVAGADIVELQHAAWGRTSKLPMLHDLLANIEDSPKPVVAALHGTVFGGGLELAMACHFRIAERATILGQPEVNLGIIPGAEGTQRLPRLVGIEKAIEMCVSGKPVKASDALTFGLVDSVIDGDLASQAEAFVRALAAQSGPYFKTRDLDEKLETGKSNPALFTAGRDLAQKTRRNEIAPLRVVDAIEAAATLPFEEGCRREREIFVECVQSDQAKALLHLFFAERAVSNVPGVPKGADVRPINTVAVIGAGTMGGGIAMACVNSGLKVLLKEAKQEALDAGLTGIRRNYETAVKRGRFTPEVVEQRLALIRPQLDYAGFDSADLIIEAVFENLELKKRIFSELDPIAKPDCVLATNTSSLDVDAIASTTSRRQSVLGLHFFSPANVMRLLEIVRGANTSSEVLASAMSFAKRVGKVGVIVRNGPGFVGNRMMFPYMYEAQFLVEEGATPEQVDKALTNFGMAMGIFAVDDLAGIDVACRVRQEMGHFAESGAREPSVQDKLYEMGRLGQKTGRGWYRYDENRKPIPDPEVVDLIRKQAAEAGIEQRTLTQQEIVERLIYALINEGARVLEEGLALRASDIDVIYTNGYGFPAWRGGPMFFASLTGLQKIVQRINQFHDTLGPRWQQARLLEELASKGKTFLDYDAQRVS